MGPAVVLFTTWLLGRLAGALGLDVLDGWQPSLRVAVAAMFVLTGLAHFGSRRREMIEMVPAGLPRPALLVTATGVLELLGALGLLVPATASVAGWCLAVLVVAMFPANVHAARRGLNLGGKPVTPLPLRCVLQLVFVAAFVAAAA